MTMEALSLYRSLLRSARPLPYNFRQYAKRRSRDSFVENRSLSDTRQIQEVFQNGLEELRMLKRQGTIHAMYHTDPLVVEVCLYLLLLMKVETGRETERQR